MGFIILENDPKPKLDLLLNAIQNEIQHTLLNYDISKSRTFNVIVGAAALLKYHFLNKYAFYSIGPGN